ncbi:HEXXH motif-containing putative peptide modification protein [Solwaraspora sp. WMMD792]|uniref:aKG-HExxH-type peptide beta-hydroxylase n=1 Tax=Solwaraspora sp. WMMD792 TaxID=3016099 RepID=UPI0024171A5F|nr:HEXXH motif-containing putative peptide modification protein [Solwaraspora sp. WMMD792]MDG4772252.1 HEXXH motif-containing putative peptide modification protein [Solwaraspora sp. WMMD792]
MTTGAPPTDPGRRHGLTRAQFDALAAGGGDTGTLSALGRAQLSKRLLLLRELRLRTRLGETGQQAWAVLDTAVTQSSTAAATVLSRPFVDLWAHRLLHGRQPVPGSRRDGDPQPDRSPPGPPGPEYLTGLAAAAAMATGTAFELSLPVGVETVLIPGLGRVGGLGPRHRVLRYDGTVLRTGDARQAYRVVHCRGPAGDLAIEIDDLDPHRSCFGLPVTDRLRGRPLSRLRAHLPQAWTLIGTDLVQYAPTVAGCLRSLVPAGSPGGSVSASHQRTYGAVAISVPADAAELALLMVHETQHTKLSAVLDLFALTDPDCPDVFHAPWRTDPRPASALLQGIYAHVAVADFWRARRSRLTGPARRGADFEYVLWRDQCRRAIDAFAGSSALTPLGETFVERLADTLHGWPGAADAEVQAGVSACMTVADVQWRLRNLQVPAEQLSPLAAAFRAGLDASTQAVEVELAVARPAGGAAMAASLVRRIRQETITGRASVVAAPPAPGIRDDRTADRVSVLDRRLFDDPDDAEAWAMLALELTPAAQSSADDAPAARPELVRALLGELRRAGAADVRPSALVRWLSAAGPVRTAEGRYRS